VDYVFGIFVFLYNAHCSLLIAHCSIARLLDCSIGIIFNQDHGIVSKGRERSLHCFNDGWISSFFEVS